MISPQRINNNEDASTVQITTANSLLGTHLLEADWDEALQHLATPEGIHDVNNNNDPLGLSRHHRSKSHPPNVPRNKTSALFAALFVRAPFDVIAKIYDIAPLQYEPDDWMYVLSVIPSEEAERLRLSRPPSVPYRSRAWSTEEYNDILRFLLQHSVKYPMPSNCLVKCPSWILPFALTPLAIAAYNLDVSHKVLQAICALEPRAICVECTLFGVATTPLFIAAASPVPPKPSANAATPVTVMRYEQVTENRWNKVKSLVIGSEWYTLHSHNIGNNPLESVSREPTIHEIHDACLEAIKRNEWELVREFLKRHQDESLPVVQAQLDHTNLKGDGMDVDITVSPVAIAEPLPGQVVSSMEAPLSSSSVLSPIRNALMDHDQKTNTQLQKQQHVDERARARDEWAHKNMGLAMYPIHAAVDLANAMVPSSWRKKARGKSDKDEMRGIVPVMS